MTTGDGGDERASPWRDVRRYPATWGLCAVWIAVFLGMCWDQGGLRSGGDALSGGISIAAAHDFGSISPAEVRSGQVWRALTATCIHFGVIHIALNMIAFWQLGRMIEEWYGSAQFLGLYVVIGALANLIAAAARLTRPVGWNDPGGGGSGVVCGLVALVAVVGWRSRTREGVMIARRLLGLLAATALLGVLVPQVDNRVHAAGAVLGGLIGLVHRRLLRNARSVSARLIGSAALATLIVSAALQATYAEAEHRLGRDIQGLRVLSSLASAFFEESSARGGRYHGPTPFPYPLRESPRVSKRRALNDLIRVVDRMRGSASRGDPDDEALTRMIDVAKVALRRRPTPGEVRAFEVASRRIFGRVEGDTAAVMRRLSSLRVPWPAPAPIAAGPRVKAR